MNFVFNETKSTPLSIAIAVGPFKGELFPPAEAPLCFEEPATLLSPKMIPELGAASVLLPMVIGFDV